MKASNGWKVSTLQVLERLKTQPDHTVNGFPVTELKYTILDTNDVVYRSAGELAELNIATGTIPKFLVAFKPERIALHEAIVEVSTQLQLKDEAEMQAVVTLLLEEQQTKISEAAKELEQLRGLIQEEVTKQVDALYNKETIPSSLENKIIQDTYKQAISKNVSDKFGQYKSDFNERDAIIALATDKIYTEHVTKRMSTIINEGIASLVEKGAHKPMVPPDPNERMTFMVAGGPASGKGSSVVLLQMKAANLGLDWENVAKLNTDSYKSMLLKPGSVNPYLYSQLAQEEASLVSIKIQNKLDLMASNKKAPHVFVDQVFLGDDKLTLAEKNGGKTRAIVVSTEVVTAVERSFARGEELGQEGRYENTRGILNCHKEMTKQLVSNLAKHQDQDIEVLFCDNNVGRGQKPVNFMKIDFKNKEIEIYNEKMLDRFLQKINININAESKEEAYIDASPVSSANYLKPLTDMGFKTTYPQNETLQIQQQNSQENTNFKPSH